MANKDPSSIKAEPLSDVVREVQKYVVGMREELWLSCVSLLSGGHLLLQGPPGSGKTLLASTFTRAIGGEFKRIQMTPDLLPSDIIGTNVYNIGTGTWSVRRGPIFANVVLLDELNRATPRTQAALLEAMQESRVTIEGMTFHLPSPTFFMATQVGSGSEGTYPLTDVQVDRFAFSAEVALPGPDEEAEVISRVDLVESADVKEAATTEEISDLIEKVRAVKVSPAVKRYIVSLVGSLRASRDLRAPLGLRASVWLYKGARAVAFLDGREYVIPDDVKAIAESALAHRLRLRAESLAEGVTAKSLVEKALDGVPVPKS